ncbi:hypothetical protein SDC9_101938 [bioreactor metagenome]|uniref:N-acetyltransferase domain-containing protein n=1 Tax=bioreactor metagenome TaxID=1076179 RepID=A0A645APG5_9ZZZZ
MNNGSVSLGSSGSQARRCGTPALRPIVFSDEDALIDIFASTREAEHRQFGWPEPQWNDFIRQQFIAQHTQYSTAYANPHFSVVLFDGEIAGRFYVDRGAQEIRLVDIALLPQYRRQGLGRQLLQALIDESDALGIPIGLHVEKNNSILEFYQHLGFVAEMDRGVYWYMRRAPRPMRMPTPEDFVDLVGTDFTLHLNDSPLVTLRLEEATVTHGLHTQQCSLCFVGPDIERPAHETYLLSHASLGCFALFLGPVMGVARTSTANVALGQTCYQALITRRNQSKEDEAT